MISFFKRNFFIFLFLIPIGLCVYFSIKETQRNESIFKEAKIGNPVAMSLLKKQLKYKKVSEIDFEILDEAMKGNKFIIEVLNENKGRK